MSRKYEIHRLHDRTSFAVLFVVCCASSALTVAARLGAPGQWSSTEIGEALAAPVQNGNNALFFDGVNDYLEIPEIAAVRTEKREPLTVEFWAFVPSYGDTWHKMLSKWGAGGGQDDEFVVCLRQDGTFGVADTGSTGLGSRTLFATAFDRRCGKAHLGYRPVWDTSLVCMQTTTSC